jgi:hypothetical protein
LKPRYLGIAGAIIAFIGLALPWWTMTMSASAMGVTYPKDVWIYTYQVTINVTGMPATFSINLWYAWTALALVIVGAVLGILGSLMQSTRLVLVVGVVLTLLAVVIFAVGLQNELSKSIPLSGGPKVDLFSSGSFLGSDYMTYLGMTYLSFGFWLVLVAAILMLVATRKGPVTTTPTPAPPQPTPQPTN